MGCTLPSCRETPESPSAVSPMSRRESLHRGADVRRESFVDLRSLIDSPRVDDLVITVPQRPTCRAGTVRHRRKASLAEKWMATTMYETVRIRDAIEEETLVRWVV